MTSAFDEAFAAAGARRDAERADQEARRQADAERAASEARWARSVAEPYLRSVGTAARQRLLELGVPPTRTTDFPPKLQDWEYAAPVASVRRLQVGFWNLCRPMTIGEPTAWNRPIDPPRLFLTEDGLFKQREGYSAADGFEDLLSSLTILTPLKRSSVSSGIFVEEGSDAVVVGCAYSRGYNDVREFETFEFADFAARQVLLLSEAGR